MTLTDALYEFIVSVRKELKQMLNLFFSSQHEFKRYIPSCWNCLIALKAFYSPVNVMSTDKRHSQSFHFQMRGKIFGRVFLRSWLYASGIKACSFSHRAAAGVTDGSQYFVLLMITDGVISDMVQTKEAVVNVRLSSTIILYCTCQMRALSVK